VTGATDALYSPVADIHCWASARWDTIRIRYEYESDYESDYDYAYEYEYEYAYAYEYEYAYNSAPKVEKLCHLSALVVAAEHEERVRKVDFESQ
jgi:hypothetical protein